MPRLKDYANRVAVVTGASSGIGEALALQLAERGARVALLARRRDKLEAVAERARQKGGQVHVMVCDVAEREQAEGALAEVVKKWGRLDILVNNAGTVKHGLFQHETPEQMEYLVRANFLSVLYLTAAALPEMRKAGEGFVVNVSSFAGKIGQPDEAVYSATKSAITGLSEALGLELEPLGIHVLCVHPVLIRTEAFPPEALERLPHGMEKRFITAEELGAEVLRALERGETDITIPRGYRWIYLLRALFPRLMRRKMGEVKMERILAEAARSPSATFPHRHR